MHTANISDLRRIVENMRQSKASIARGEELRQDIGLEADHEHAQRLERLGRRRDIEDSLGSAAHDADRRAREFDQVS